MLLEIGAEAHERGFPIEVPHPTRPLVQHAELIDGRFTFSNCSDLTLATKTFAPLNIEFRDISKFLDRKRPHIIKAIRYGGEDLYGNR